MKQYLIESANEAERLDYQNEIDVYNLEGELRKLNLLGVRSLLDAGCGHGNLIEKIQHMDVDLIHGMDISKDRVRLAQNKFHTDPRVRIMQGSLERTGIDSGTYDAVISRYVFEHVTNAQEILSELARVLKPGGRLFVINFDGVFFNFHTKNEFFNQQLKELQLKLPQDFDIGRKLPQMMKLAGVGHVEWEAESFYFQGSRLKAEISNSKMRLEQARSLLSPFFNSPYDYDLFAKCYLEEMEDDCNVMSMAKFIIRGQKAEERHMKLVGRS